MKFPLLYAVLIYAGLMIAPAHLPGQPATNAVGPQITFATNQYNFGKVTAGTLVKYVFIVTNTGDQPLEISNVAPGCHCTTAKDWTHHIAPGQTGQIPIQLDTSSFRGAVTKTITVTSNDKLAPRQTISLQGTIWKMIEITPQFAYITITPDAPSNVTSVVHISNKADEPVTLSNLISANKSFKGELKTITPGKEFEVTITAVPPFAPGNTTGTISLKTSFAKMPEVTITTIAMMQPALVVIPLQIVLPPPKDGWMTNRVTIAANGKKAISLSDLKVSDTNIIVELKTIIPGHNFQLIVASPPGFQIAPGQQAQVTLKSDSPEFPVITVPIRQYSRQSVAPPPRPKVISQNPPSPSATGHP